MNNIPTSAFSPTNAPLPQNGSTELNNNLPHSKTAEVADKVAMGIRPVEPDSRMTQLIDRINSGDAGALIEKHLACRPDHYAPHSPTSSGWSLKLVAWLAEHLPDWVVSLLRSQAGVSNLDPKPVILPELDPSMKANVERKQVSLDEWQSTMDELAKERAPDHFRNVDPYKLAGKQIEELKARKEAFLAKHPEYYSVIADAVESYNNGAHPTPWQLPVLLKSEYPVEGLPTNSGVPGGAVANATMGAVEELVQGLIKDLCFAGKSIQAELGFNGTGMNPSEPNVENPNKPGHVPGGSSTAVEVAINGVAGLAGSDGMGSIRLPAGYLGLIGAKDGKTSDGKRLFSQANGPYEKSQLVALGAIAPNFDIVRTMTEAMAGNNLPEKVRDHKTMCLGVDVGAMLSADPEVRNQFIKALDVMIDKGYTLKPIDVLDLENHPENAKNLGYSGVVKFGHEEAGALGHLTPTQLANASAEIRLNGAMAQTFTDEMVERADTNANALKQRYNDLYEMGVDAILSPTTLTTAPEFSESERKTGKADLADSLMIGQLTMQANLTERSATSQPIGVDSNGLPVGLMMTCTSEDHIGLLPLLAIGADIQNQFDRTEGLTMPKPQVYIEP